MAILGVAGFLFFCFVVLLAILIAVGVIVRRHWAERAENAVSIARIQAQTSEENAWSPWPKPPAA